MAEAEINPTIAALYNSTKAALDFSLQNKIAQGNLAKRTTNQNFDYARGNAVRQMPQRFQAIRNQANSQGLAESGVLAQTTQRQAANNIQQLTGLGQQREQAIKRINAGTFSAGEEHRVGLEQAGARQKKEQMEFDIANYHAPTTGTQNTLPSQAPPPGWIGTTQKGGSVSYSPPVTITGGYQQPSSAGSARKKAAKKAVG